MNDDIISSCVSLCIKIYRRAIRVKILYVKYSMCHAITTAEASHNFHSVQATSRGYPAKRALSAMRKHGG